MVAKDRYPRAMFTVKKLGRREGGKVDLGEEECSGC